MLILLGIQMSLGITFPKEKDDMSEVAVVIGTPMITGPATISAAIILGASDGVITTVVAGSAASFAGRFLPWYSPVTWIRYWHERDKDNVHYDGHHHDGVGIAVPADRDQQFQALNDSG